MLLLDSLHIALAAEPGDGDEPNGYMKAMVIRAVTLQRVKLLVFRAMRLLTHDIGTIFRYRLGKGTPALFVRRRGKVSGILSSLRADERTSVMRFLVKPTQTLNSFMLHGCSRQSDQLLLSEWTQQLPTFVVLGNE
jgi:hypothetical protein